MVDTTSNADLPPFNPGDTSTVSARWKKWKRSFQIFLDVQNVAIPARKKSYLLHYVGTQVQDIFFSLLGEAEPEVPAGSDVYQEAVKKLDEYFLPMKCLPLERHKFRNLGQAEDEPIETFVLRLREQGNLCEYADHLEEEIKEQIFEKGTSDDLRAKILNKPQMTLAETVEAGRSLETIGKHRKTSVLNPGLEEVNKVTQYNRRSKSSAKGECYRCGRSGHFANNKNCPALDKKCERCGLVGHFKKRCNTKRKKKLSKKRLRKMLADLSSDGSEDSDFSEEESDGSYKDQVKYLFATDPARGEKVVCAVGGVKVTWVVDSGAGVNVINRQTWEHLKQRKVRVNHQTTAVKKSLKAYGGHPIKVAGMFSADVATQKKVLEAEIYVVENGNCCLLGRKTAKALGILDINTSVWASGEEYDDRIEEITGTVAKIQINPNVNSVQQTQHHIPIPLRENAKREIRRLLKQDGIEEVPRVSARIPRLIARPKAVQQVQRRPETVESSADSVATGKKPGQLETHHHNLHYQLRTSSRRPVWQFRRPLNNNGFITDLNDDGHQESNL